MEGLIKKKVVFVERKYRENIECEILWDQVWYLLLEIVQIARLPTASWKGGGEMDLCEAGQKLCEVRELLVKQKQKEGAEVPWRVKRKPV